MSSIGGQRSRMARASFSHPLIPARRCLWKTMRISFASKIAIASSAFPASDHVTARFLNHGRGEHSSCKLVVFDDQDDGP